MRIHYLQHVPFEGPAAIADWVAGAGHLINGSHLYRRDPLPDPTSFDMLVILGGPMSVNDESEFPWLIEEKRLVRAAIESRRPVLGVCLGAQMIASALGAPVYRAAEKEIGWFPVRRTTSKGAGASLPQEFTPLHWHGETFDLPLGGIRLAETSKVPNQAFQIGSNVIGLQFHVEATPASVHSLIENAAHEIEVGKPLQQSPETMAERTPAASLAVRPVLHSVMNYLAETIS